MRPADDIAPAWRRLPIAAAMLALMLLLAGLGIVFQSARNVQAQQEREFSVQAQTLAASVVAALDFGDRSAGQESVNAFGVDAQIQTVVVFDQQGRLFAGFRRGDGRLPADERAIGASLPNTVVGEAPVVRDGERIGSVHMSRIRDPLSRRAARFSIIVLFIVMTALVVGVLGVAHTMLRRANAQLTARARDLAATNRELEIQMEERAKAEEQLRQAQKMQALGQLTGGIAHDFNNLLTVIQGSADILQRPDLSEEKRLKFAGAIVQSAGRAAALTGQLLAFARRQPLQPETMDVNGRIAGMHELLDRTLGERIEVVTELGSDSCAIEADPAQLEAAILNIAVNARDAMPDGGTLTIRTGSAIDETGRKATAIAISDTGTGMDAETQARVFEPFFTTKVVGKGTGLGLSQVYGFATQSGGDVLVESAPGQGTTVTILLPCSESEVQPTVVDEPREAGGDVHGLILVVDDNEEVGAFAETLLRELGHDVVRARSAEEAFELVGRHPIDAVFTDVVMPGMSGIELAHRLRGERPTLPVVLTTGYSDQISQAGSGGLPVVFKPYRPDAIATALDAAMKRDRTS